MQRSRKRKLYKELKDFIQSGGFKVLDSEYPYILVEIDNMIYRMDISKIEKRDRLDG